jgi:putative transposase
MPSSWTQNYYHAVFGTKGREPLITPEFEPRLHAYLGGIARDLGCSALIVNGIEDHVHILARFRSDLSISDFIRHIKFRSSRWVHEEFAALPHFAWQEGYGGFTVSRSMVDKVHDYIAGQKEHHRAVSFQEEFLELLRRHGIEFDPADVFK